MLVAERVLAVVESASAFSGVSRNLNGCVPRLRSLNNNHSGRTFSIRSRG